MIRKAGSASERFTGVGEVYWLGSRLGPPNGTHRSLGSSVGLFEAIKAVARITHSVADLLHVAPTSEPALASSLHF